MIWVALRRQRDAMTKRWRCCWRPPSAISRSPRRKVRETMVKVFHAIGVRSPLADDYRDKLAAILY